MLGAHTWITDQAPLLDLMAKNIALNNLEKSVHVAELNWGVPLPTSFPSPDIVLAADCVYLESAFPLLVQTLSDLSERPVDILFCYKKRRKADKRFFTLLKKKFDWTEIMDHPDRETYTREAISLMRLERRK
ncbi:hypothetical protein SISSUDRAFT_1043220 [Sistotremastrum suecicum HHB10207 ss-3]|uniref:Protein-lysine N-methyltransferase EFM6 n=1 Tax=Sistotremastrum suecicum HHB10207 ss-3 TaxID=1314776 RepID=A0A166FYX5_9AGAM|nr:hypothetical protein SISSUDRAFT_1043220 [Sistotremastrum suecicum HHB10207 ss-3]